MQKRNDKGQILNGNPMYTVGTIRIRTRHKRNMEKRKYIKIAEPSKWMLNCVYVWGKHNKSMPKGYFVHHIDSNKLNDNIENLSLVTRAEHLEIHRPEFRDKAIASFIAARRKLRWSTKKKST